MADHDAANQLQPDDLIEMQPVENEDGRVFDDDHVNHDEDDENDAPTSINLLLKSINPENLAKLLPITEQVSDLLTNCGCPKQERALLCALALAVKARLETIDIDLAEAIFLPFSTEETLKAADGSIAPRGRTLVQPTDDSGLTSVSFMARRNSSRERVKLQKELAEKNKALEDLQGKLKTATASKSTKSTDAAKQTTTSDQPKDAPPNTQKGIITIPDPVKELIRKARTTNLAHNFGRREIEQAVKNLVDELSNKVVKIRGHANQIISPNDAISLVGFFCGELCGLQGLKNATQLISQYRSYKPGGPDHGYADRLEAASELQGMPILASMVLQAVSTCVRDEVEEGTHLVSFRKQIHLCSMMGMLNDLVAAVDKTTESLIDTKFDQETHDWFLHNFVKDHAEINRSRDWRKIVVSWLESFAKQHHKINLTNQMNNAKMLFAAVQTFGPGIFVIAPVNLYVKLKLLGGLTVLNEVYPIIQREYTVLWSIAEFFSENVAVPIMRGEEVTLGPFDTVVSDKDMMDRLEESKPKEITLPDVTGYVEDTEVDMDDAGA